MSPGQWARKILGPARFKQVGRLYRAVFLDLDAMVRCVSSAVPEGARVLDVGTGDGAPINALLDLRPDIRVDCIDLAVSIGGWIDSAHEARVSLFPGTSIREYCGLGRAAPEAIVMCDVVHHVPPAARAQFFQEVAGVMERSPACVWVIKDIEPGHWRSGLSLLSDKYVTGDRGVELISQTRLVELVSQAVPGVKCSEPPQPYEDKPNYAVAFKR